MSSPLVMVCGAVVVCLALAAALALPAGEGGPAIPAPAPMDNAALDRFIRAAADEVDGGDGQWTAKVGGVQVVMLSDETHDRMRLICPIIEAAEVKADQMDAMMEANFDRTLDARYAVWRGWLWAVYVHPLGSCSRQQLQSGLRQILALRRNFGTTYNSDELVFAPAEGGGAPAGGAAGAGDDGAIEQER